MVNDEEAYEIRISTLITYSTFDVVKKVQAIQTKSLTFFRYVAISYDYNEEEINEVKFFLDREEAIACWNDAISTHYYIPIPNRALAVIA